MYLTARRLPSDKLIHSNSCLQRACERLSCTLPAWHAAGSGWYLPPIRGSASNGGNRSVLTRPGRLMGTALLLNTFFPPAGSRGLMISRSLFSFFFLTRDVYLTRWRKKKDHKPGEERGGEKKKAFACICRQHAHTCRQWHTGRCTHAARTRRKVNLRMPASEDSRAAKPLDGCLETRSSKALNGLGCCFFFFFEYNSKNFF